MLRFLVSSIFLGLVTGGRLRSRDHVATQAQHRTKMPAEAVGRVITMLENLIADMDAEQASDEKQFAEFQVWCTESEAETELSISTLESKIETLTALLATLYSQKMELETVITRLNGEIDVTRSQIAQATEKRNEERNAFNQEQTDFDNSIAACGKAVDILKGFYGEGEKELVKPDFMGLVQVTNALKKTVKNRGVKVNPKLMAFLQGPFDRFEAKTGEANNIVDQMKLLGETFAEDKQSAIDEENKLQELYTNLMTEKTQILNSLVAERDENQASLDAVNQDIAEKETAKGNAQAELTDERAYLAQVQKSCTDTAALFEQRKKDRAEEKMATGEAIKVLNGDAGEAFAQIDVKTLSKHKRHLQLIQQHSHHKSKGNCPACTRASSLLSKAAALLHSGTLATAAAATMGSDAVKDVVTALNGLITNLDNDAKMEAEHKEWCEHELSTTAAKKATHESNVEELTQKIADETETVAEKKQAILDTMAAIKRADTNFKEAKALRAEQKASFEEELQNYNDAIEALNQAMDILSKFYASKKSAAFDQVGASPKKMAPGVFDSAYEQKGGMGVVQMISTVRKEYEQGKADLEAAEAQAIVDFNAAEAAYNQNRADLVAQGNRLNAELQTAEANLAQFKEDKTSNEDDIKAAIVYLGQLKTSCSSLLANFDERVKLRNEEKDAINQAITVLENES